MIDELPNTHVHVIICIIIIITICILYVVIIYYRCCYYIVRVTCLWHENAVRGRCAYNGKYNVLLYALNKYAFIIFYSVLRSALTYTAL